MTGDFIQQQQRSQARDIIGLLQATETLLASIKLSPQDALALSIRVANLCAGVQKEARRMASRCGEKEAAGGPWRAGEDEEVDRRVGIC